MSKTIEQLTSHGSETLLDQRGEDIVADGEAHTVEYTNPRSESTEMEAGRKVCIISSSRNALEQRMFLKEGMSLARAGYRVSVVAPHPYDEVISGITIKAVPKCASRFSRVARTTWYVYREALRQRAQVYHFHNTELIPVGWLLKLQGKRV